MAIRRRKPTSPGRRFQTQADFSEITKSIPEKSLTSSKSKTGGRNNYGRKTSRHRGGGHKQLYRQIDFRRDKTGVPATVASIEYDPNRTTFILNLSTSILLNFLINSCSIIFSNRTLGKF